MSSMMLCDDRVNIFREKSRDKIDRLHFCECFKDKGRTRELTAHNTALAHILKDAPIVTFAESFVRLLFGVFAVYLKPVFNGNVILCSFLFAP